ncbi:MAG: hypothetical protein BRC40_16140 [Cyanobacteria bacterium QH_8_48_120]|jgi:hypothetical protein|nr:MAG: hypothetical protein BRC34_06995 [Cyanobacteria bacterium QH_1_48_107]PSO64246.1 MAG: hypothetical protein BRC38_11910 [Cyanobacteria bacterium QH_6_48_35]PSO68930.1 MAG: hypothetical protein BRC40_16140 [Cyanobacteria bacterium QH_8_48_120]
MSLNHPKTALLTLVVPLTAAIALGSYQATAHAQAELIDAQVKSADREAVTIHRYESRPMDAVNSYWIETDEGIS